MSEVCSGEQTFAQLRTGFRLLPRLTRLKLMARPAHIIDHHIVSKGIITIGIWNALQTADIPQQKATYRKVVCFLRFDSYSLVSFTRVAVDLYFTRRHRNLHTSTVWRRVIHQWNRKLGRVGWCLISTAQSTTRITPGRNSTHPSTGKKSDSPFSTLDILSFVTLEKIQENKMKWNWEAAIYKSGGIPKQ